MRSEEFRKAFEEKFNIDLTNRPDMITVRGCCSEKDGKIHTDSETKIITILVYMNSAWESSGGRLRLLRSGTNLDDVILEVPPTEGTLLAFRRSTNSWHGHRAKSASIFRVDEKAPRCAVGRKAGSLTVAAGSYAHKARERQWSFNAGTCKHLRLTWDAKR
jgi:hypothetical protein